LGVFGAIAERDPVAIASVLARNPEQVDARDPNGHTPIGTTLRTGDRRLVDAVLRFNPALGVVDLAATGRTEALRRLLRDKPAAVHHVEPDGLTPLHLVASWNEATNAEVLLDAGADMLAPASVRYMRITPAQTAVRANATGVLRRMLARGLDANTQIHPKLGTFLHLAALLNLRESYRLLMEYGGDESTPDAAGRTPPEAAAQIDRIVANGRDPLVRLLRRGNAEQLGTYLGENPQRLDETFDVGAGPMSPLEIALQSNDEALWKMVLKHSRGLTIGDLAALNREDALAQLLRRHPEAIGWTNARGMKPAAVAASSGAVEALRTLLDAGQEAGDSSLLRAALTQPDDSVWHLLAARGADFAACYAAAPEDFIPLVRQPENEPALRFLVEQGIDVGLEHPMYGSILDFAREHGTRGMVAAFERGRTPERSRVPRRDRPRALDDSTRND